MHLYKLTCNETYSIGILFDTKIESTNKLHYISYWYIMDYIRQKIIQWHTNFTKLIDLQPSEIKYFLIPIKNNHVDHIELLDNDKLLYNYSFKDYCRCQVTNIHNYVQKYLDAYKLDLKIQYFQKKYELESIYDTDFEINKMNVKYGIIFMNYITAINTCCINNKKNKIEKYYSNYVITQNKIFNYATKFLNENNTLFKSNIITNYTTFIGSYVKRTKKDDIVKKTLLLYINLYNNSNSIIGQKINSILNYKFKSISVIQQAFINIKNIHTNNNMYAFIGNCALIYYKLIHNIDFNEILIVSFMYHLSLVNHIITNDIITNDIIIKTFDAIIASLIIDNDFSINGINDFISNYNSFATSFYGKKYELINNFKY